MATFNGGHSADGEVELCEAKEETLVSVSTPRIMLEAQKRKDQDARRGPPPIRPKVSMVGAVDRLGHCHIVRVTLVGYKLLSQPHSWARPVLIFLI